MSPSVVEHRDLADKMSEELLAELTPDYRSEGHHVSGLIHGIVGQNPTLVGKPNTGYFDPNDWTQQLREPANRFSMGLLWEELIVKIEAKKGLLPGWELPILDGITGTPDGIHLEEEYIMESKLTWKSIRSGWPADNWRYTTQVMAYLYIIGWKTARFWMIFVNGGYSRPPVKDGPLITCTDITYTDLELAENWQMLVNESIRQENERGPQ
jgi:hypothetical protein